MSYKLILKVSFNANGGSGAPSPVSYDVTVTEEHSYRLSVTIPSTTPSRTGHNFLGWAESSTAATASYHGGDTYQHTFVVTGASSTLEHSKTLYAVWQKQTYPVNYKRGANGTGTNKSDTKTYNVTLWLRGAIFTRVGYEQIGWSTTDGGAQTYSLGAAYTANRGVTLYPVWKQLTYAYVKVNGVWKGAQVYVKVGGAWKEVVGAYVKVNGTWKPT